MHDEAMAIVAEATDDHGRLAEAGLAILPEPADRPLQVLTHCNTGPLACGQFGTALGVVQAAHQAERPLHVWVDETRPYLQGARLTAWELQQAGVAHTLLPDMAAGPLMAAGEVDVILVGADRVAANGDTANKLGTYTLAVLAARHGVPFLVCAPLSSVDLDTADGDRDPDRGPAGGGGHGDPRPAHRAGGHDGPQPLVRRDAGGADHGHRHRGGRTPAAVRAGAPRGDGPARRTPSRRNRACRGRGLMASVTLDRAGAAPPRRRRRPIVGSSRASWTATGSSAPTPSRTSRIARSRARAGASREQGDEVVSLVLEYGGPSPQPLFIAGRDDGIEAILRDVITPSIAYVACLPASMRAVESRYRIEPGPQMVRMWVDRETFQPAATTGVEPLDPSDAGELNRLYRLGFGSWLPPQAIAEGVYRGIRVNGRLVAAAGTHVIGRTRAASRSSATC